MTAKKSPDRVVAVVSDGSALAAPGAAQDTVVLMLRRYVALIEDLAGLRGLELHLDHDPRRAAAGLRGLPSEVGALFLPHVRRDFACRARDLTDVPVVTDQDTTAIALAAALLTTLTRAGRTPRASQVVIAGAGTLPILCPLLMVCGVGSVTTWNPADALSFPLRRIAADADVVIDLLGGTTIGTVGIGAFAPDLEPTVIVPDSRRGPLLALPGLLRALTRTPDARLDVEVHHACALALVMATPPDDVLPVSPYDALVDQVTDAALRALQQPAHRPFDTSSG